MTLQIISKHKDLLNEIATYVLVEQLIANAMISENIVYKEKNNAVIETTTQFVLKGISKSLLFSRINEKLR